MVDAAGKHRDEFWSQLKAPLNNVSPSEIMHMLRLARTKLGLEEINTVLDLGCGSGTSTFWLKHFLPDATVIGLDYCDTALDLARQAFGSNIVWINKSYMGAWKTASFLEAYKPIDLTVGIGVGTGSKENWMSTFADPLRSALETSGNFITLITPRWNEPWEERYKDRGCMIRMLNERKVGLNRINKFNPIYVEYDAYKLYAVYEK